ncbi:hypothetical protein HanOQP8_Chr09g0305731 [Helianthus annuus]|nr:hypothetical protein HanIR_Chr09g0391831 [Helianthus annuus]KAJ0709887.1 hypothetical protein HanOQP8_Chr09g0305731 [Helianthus annuus]
MWKKDRLFTKRQLSGERPVSGEGESGDEVVARSRNRDGEGQDGGRVLPKTHPKPRERRIRGVSGRPVVPPMARAPSRHTDQKSDFEDMVTVWRVAKQVLILPTKCLIKCLWHRRHDLHCQDRSFNRPEKPSKVLRNLTFKRRNRGKNKSSSFVLQLSQVLP